MKIESRFNYKLQKQIPNFLSSLRIILTPFCVVFLLKGLLYISLILFVLASITDYFDGYFARKYNAVSKIGSFIDPLADKIMVVSIFICFYNIYPDIVDIYILSMILFRDVVVTLMRVFMEHKGATLVTSKVSKIKTTLQIVVIVVLFINLIFADLSLFNDYFLYVFMLFTGLLTFYTGIHYLFWNFSSFKLIFFNDR
ncbi:MAG: CDP-diacylglycerol--glycerol-3-phosphate 3-phosphatidyltransferase [Candidatus Marinimicrobia bacterium]|nr:CDP-diacylglycerol--glycerol-3-phosphate 3-phosphatidyltransferase [Candidatus Neomarinimicrobiota bacterium]